MSAELRLAVAALIDGTRCRVFRDGVTDGEWHELPSVWDQLMASASEGNGQGQGGAARFHSRSVISTGVVALVIEVTDATTEGAIELVGKTRGTVPGNLRAITAHLHEAEPIGWWTEQLRDWTTQARAHLHLDPERPKWVRGVRCPDCGAKTSRRRQDGETLRMPALALTWVGPDDGDYHEDDRWMVRAVECKSCGRAWFRGEAMDSLVGMMLAASTTRETLAENN